MKGQEEGELWERMVLQKETAVMRRHPGPSPDIRTWGAEGAVEELVGGGRMGVVGVCWMLPQEVGGQMESHLALGGPSPWPTGGQVALVG